MAVKQPWKILSKYAMVTLTAYQREDAPNMAKLVTNQTALKNVLLIKLVTQ